MGFLEDSEQKRIFGNNLSYLIKVSDKDQKQIAIELDVNPPTLNQWVNGKAIPSVSMLKRLCAYFDCTLSRLVDTPEPELSKPNNLTNREIATISALRKADKGIKDAVDKLLDVDRELEYLYQMGEIQDTIDRISKKIESLDDTATDDN